MGSCTLSIAIPTMCDVLTVLDSDPQTRGIGVVVYSEKKSEWIRKPAPHPPNAGKYLLLELRDSAWNFNRLSYINGIMPQLEANSKFINHKSYVSNIPSPKPKFNTDNPRDNSSDPLKEWAGAGINCSAAGLAWLGVVAFSAAAPVTGGASMIPTLAIWGGAMAATAQCVNSSYRVANIMSGRKEKNNNLDKNISYIRIIYIIDGVSLLGAAGAVRYFYRTFPSVVEAGADSFRLSQILSKHQQRHLAFNLGLRMAAKEEVSRAAINAVLQKRLLDTLGGGGGRCRHRRKPSLWHIERYCRVDGGELNYE